MGKQLKLGSAAKFLGIAQTTIRRYADEGIIKCCTLPSGHRYFDEEDLLEFLNKKQSNTNKTNKSSAFLYARVSTKKQVDAGNLDRQVSRLLDFALSNKYEVSGLFKEIASGVNENRRELKRLLDSIKNTEGTTVIIEYKDCLARFGYQYLEKYINDFGGKIHILDNSEENDEQELVDDLIAITTSFSARIYGKRGRKKLAKKVYDGINEEE